MEVDVIDNAIPYIDENSTTQGPFDLGSEGDSGRNSTTQGPFDLESEGDSGPASLGDNAENASLEDEEREAQQAEQPT